MTEAPRERVAAAARRVSVHGPVLLLAIPALSACRQQVAPAPGGGRTEAITTAIKLDNFGYRPDDPKVAVVSQDPGPLVEVRASDERVVFRVPADGGRLESKGLDAASGDRVWWVDFTPLRVRGAYHLYSPALRAGSYPFVIAPEVYDPVMGAALKTFFFQRCGTPKAAAHAGAWADGAACHRADAATGAGRGQADHGLRDLSGGWHDAGDYNKYVWTAASNAILYLLRAYESGPAVFSDATGIPESGNGAADVLDEARWELDFLMKMQLPDGSVLSQVHAEGSDNGAAPPSADATRRYYHDPTLDSAAVLAGSCALGARVFAAAGQDAYAARLAVAARTSWRWLEGQGHRDEKAWAAAEVFRMDPTIVSSRAYVDAYRPRGWAEGLSGPAGYDAHAALAYVEAPGATPAVVAAMRAGVSRQVDVIFAADDLYRSGMPVAWYHWGSNAVRAAQGVFLLQAARLQATGSHTAEQCRRHALDILHSFHGQNPLSMVYLTNMAALGGEHSSFQLFHNWFGQSQSAYSRERFVGRPLSVAEPFYPYFTGTDNLGVGDDKTSVVGPAPGFVPGGPNRNYSGDARPPRDAATPSRFYRDWNDQSAWRARTWEITESSIGYQGPYVALVAAFASRGYH